MSIWNLIKESALAWWKSDPLSAGAAVAFYAIFSIPSALIIIISIASLFISPSLVEQTLAGRFQSIIGPQAVSFMGSIIAALRDHNGKRIPSLISVIAIIFGSIGVFTQLQLSLNKLWNVPVDETTGWRVAIRKHLLAFFVILLLGALMAASVILGIFWSIAGIWISRFIPHVGGLISDINIIQLFVVVGVVFAIMYAYLPSLRVSHTAAMIGGTVGTILFALGRELISLYLRFSSSASAYGAASALIIILLWVYYSSQIFFFGAALTYVIDRHSKKS